jgi:hypothetical protein
LSPETSCAENETLVTSRISPMLTQHNCNTNAIASYGHFCVGLLVLKCVGGAGIHLFIHPFAPAITLLAAQHRGSQEVLLVSTVSPEYDFGKPFLSTTYGGTSRRIQELHGSFNIDKGAHTRCRSVCAQTTSVVGYEGVGFSSPHMYSQKEGSAASELRQPQRMAIRYGQGLPVRDGETRRKRGA